MSLEIYGTKCGVAWDQERPDELWIGKRNSNNQILLKDPSLMKTAARSYADLPGGHSEGYDDTFKQVFRRFYASIGDPSAEPQYPQFADGLRGLTILECELKSNAAHAWVDVPASAGRYCLSGTIARHRSNTGGSRFSNRLPLVSGGRSPARSPCPPCRHSDCRRRPPSRRHRVT